MLDQPWISVIPSKTQSLYQPVTYCTYWTVIFSYNNCNIIHLSLKSIPSEVFEEIQQVVLDVISDNIASLVQYGKYVTINTSDTTTNIFYVIKFISEAYTLQNNTTIDGKFIYADSLVVKAEYLFSVLGATTPATDYQSSNMHNYSSTS